MENWWVSPALVAVGIAISVLLSLRRDARHQGVVDAIQQNHEQRITRHTVQFDEITAHIAEHGERITAVESKCDATHARWEGPERRGREYS